MYKKFINILLKSHYVFLKELLFFMLGLYLSLCFILNGALPMVFCNRYVGIKYKWCVHWVIYLFVVFQKIYLIIFHFKNYNYRYSPYAINGINKDLVLFSWYVTTVVELKNNPIYSLESKRLEWIQAFFVLYCKVKLKEQT